MAAPTASGYGLGVSEDANTVDIDDVKLEAPKAVAGLAAEGVEGEEKHGSEACPEGAGSDEAHGEEQVAKKPRVEKAENGAADDGYGVESLEGVVEKDGGEQDHGGLNGGAEEVENGVVGAGEKGTEESVGKDAAAPGDGGLRDLLQEGDDTKTSVVNHGADAAHMLNGTK